MVRCVTAVQYIWVLFLKIDWNAYLEEKHFAKKKKKNPRCILTLKHHVCVRV